MASSGDLPSSVDLRPLMTPIENQGQANSVTAVALASLVEFLNRKNLGETVDVSRLFIYYNARLIDGLSEDSMTDHGCTIASAVKSLAEYGWCREESFPYDLTNVNTKPPEECYSEASNNLIDSATKLNVDLDEMKECLANGYPFMFGLKIFHSFTNAGSNNGLVSIPSEDGADDSRHGKHALVAVGYSDASQSFIVRNSWGQDWGDNGYCYIPYDYMCNGKYCSDPYALK